MKESEQKGDMEGSTEHFEGEIIKQERRPKGLQLGSGDNGSKWNSSLKFFYCQSKQSIRVIVDLLTKATWNLGSVVPENKP